MTVVIKKDGNRESFNRGKITKGIERAAKRVDMDSKKAKEVAARVARKVEETFSNRDEVRSRDIRERVIKNLERGNKRVAKEFRSFSKD